MPTLGLPVCLSGTFHKNLNMVNLSTVTDSRKHLLGNLKFGVTGVRNTSLTLLPRKHLLSSATHSYQIQNFLQPFYFEYWHDEHEKSKNELNAK